MSIILQKVSVNSGAYIAGTKFESNTQGDGSERPVVEVGTSALPTGAATQATLAALLTELQLKADLTETQPVSDNGGSLTVDNGGTFAVQSTPGADYSLQVARGLVAGVSRVNKFGAAPSGVQTTTTDIWTRADATPTQQIWIAPTQARIHAIVSTSVQDAAGGTGAASVIVYGLKTWASAETNETITLTGTNPVNTVNSYVIIHRMKAVAQASTTNVGVNVGTISATAATDGTITAVIGVNSDGNGDGQTEMAIYGVPSGYTFYLKRWSCGIDKNATNAVTADFRLRVCENPTVNAKAFLRKDDISLQSTGTNSHERCYEIPPSFAGPCIIKVQAIGSAADIDGESGFDGYIVAN
jgi:hypothetical protein